MTNGAPSLNPTESAELAGALFDDVLTPLANAKREAGAEPYFALGRDDGLASYFVRPAVTSMRPADFEFPGDGGSEGLIEALVAHWTREGEAELAATAPRLAAIAAAIERAAARDDGSVDIFCYTLF